MNEYSITEADQSRPTMESMVSFPFRERLSTVIRPRLVLLRFGVCFVATGDQRQRDEEWTLTLPYHIHPLPVTHIFRSALRFPHA